MDKKDIDNQTLTIHFLQLFIKHSDILCYNTHIYNIIKYFNYDYAKIWYMDLWYNLMFRTNKSEYPKIKEILNNIAVNEINYEYYELLKSKCIDGFMNIINDKYSDKIIEQYKQLFSLVKSIPELKI